MYPTQTTVPVADKINETTASAATETVLTPRFYTTDFAEMDRLDVSGLQAEWDALLAEFKSDPNKGHFKRNAEFEGIDLSSWDPVLRDAFVDFLTSSVTAEFSGCILYAEIRKRVKNKDIRDLFGYMSRDEGRHAGFINHTLHDLKVPVNLSFLTKAKKYTFFKPKYIYYATYLSEKIGYARYITIFRQLEANPQFRFHPIFKWFDEWCNDEFRHGEAFAVLMRSNPHLLEGGNRLWIRFFVLAVYCTMYVRDHMRPNFFAALGMTPDWFDWEVFKKTSAITTQVFPFTLDTDAPIFRELMQKMYENTVAIGASRTKGGLFGGLTRLGLMASNALCFVRLFVQPVKEHTLPANPRYQPAY
jgi:magnesium-protoporphyrin IX monomethyl ester (oxidative) cyclase